MSEKKKIRAGVIGVGNMGSAHSQMIRQGRIEGLELCAVADRNPARREWAARELGADVALFEEGAQLIDSGLCDAVIVAVPHYQHPELVIRALEKDIHTLCEKPAGVYAKQVRQMNEAAARSRATFAIMFNQRTNCLYRKMHELVSSGRLGRIKRVNWLITDWYRTQSYYDSGDWRATWSGEGGGVLLNQCPHNLDLLQWICGMPSRVTAFCHEGKWHDIEVEDDVTAFLEYENGATGVFITTTGDAPGTNRFEVDCEMGKLVCEEGRLLLYKNDKSDIDFCRESAEGFAKPGCEKITLETDGKNEQHAGVLTAFAAHILTGAPLIARGEEGIRGLQLSNAMHLSSWLGRAVDVPVDEELFLAELNKRRAASRRKPPREAVYADTRGTYGV